VSLPRPTVRQLAQGLNLVTSMLDISVDEAGAVASMPAVACKRSNTT